MIKATKERRINVFVLNRDLPKKGWIEAAKFLGVNPDADYSDYDKAKKDGFAEFIMVPREEWVKWRGMV